SLHCQLSVLYQNGNCLYPSDSKVFVSLLLTKTKSDIHFLVLSLTTLGCTSRPSQANSLIFIGLPPLVDPGASQETLLPLFLAFVSFVFKGLQPLFEKHRGWGTSAERCRSSQVSCRGGRPSPVIPADVLGAALPGGYPVMVRL